MQVLTMDFETRSKINIKKCGSFKYAQDQSTSVLCLAYSFGKGNIEIWYPSLSFPESVSSHINSGLEVHCHNAEFEFAIWNYCFAPKMHLPKISWTQMRCSSARAAVLSFPRSLAQLSRVLKVTKEKDMVGNRLMMKLSTPKKHKDGNLQFYEGTKEEYQRLYEYCKSDVETEILCENKMLPLTPDELKCWILTQKINDRGIYFDKESVLTALEFVEQYVKEKQKELSVLTNGEISTGKQVAKILERLRALGLSIENLSASEVKKQLLDEDLCTEARQLLELRQSLSLSSISKLTAMLNMCCEDQRIRGTILYHGSHTGRFSGRGIQVQNFPRGTISNADEIFDTLKLKDYDFFKSMYPSVPIAISSALRGMLTASPHHVLFAGDFASIEARGVLWLAEDEAGLNIFRRGEDIYKSMASDIYSVKIEDVTKSMRQVGKVAILALNYGMGAPKFVFTCENFGVVITLDFAKKVVDIFREKFRLVKDYWYAINAHAIKAVKTGGVVYSYKNLKFLYAHNRLAIKLPSGRNLYYNEPKISLEMKYWGEVESLSYMSQNSLSRKWESESTYGGKIFENVVQGICRDLMVFAVENIENAGFKVLMTVHDEVVAEAHIGKNKTSEEFENLMTQAPLWAKGFPIDAEAYLAVRYKK